MKLKTLLVSVAAIAGLTSSVNAYATATLSVWHSSATAHNELHHILVGDRHLDAGVSLPSGVVRSDGASAALLCFTPTGAAGTDTVASYDIRTGGWSLDNEHPSHAPQSGACANELQG